MYDSEELDLDLNDNKINLNDIPKEAKEYIFNVFGGASRIYAMYEFNMHLPWFIRKIDDDKWTVLMKGLIPFNYIKLTDEQMNELNSAFGELQEDLKEKTVDDVELYTCGYIKEDGTVIELDEYHGEEDSLRNCKYVEYSNTHPEEDTCIRIFKKPTEEQYKAIERIIDMYLDSDEYCKLEVWEGNKYVFYKVYSLYEGACQDPTWDEQIGNWSGYKLVNIMKNYFNNLNEDNNDVELELDVSEQSDQVTDALKTIATTYSDYLGDFSIDYLTELVGSHGDEEEAWLFEMENYDYDYDYSDSGTFIDMFNKFKSGLNGRLCDGDELQLRYWDVEEDAAYCVLCYYEDGSNERDVVKEDIESEDTEEDEIELDEKDPVFKYYVDSDNIDVTEYTTKKKIIEIVRKDSNDFIDVYPTFPIRIPVFLAERDYGTVVGYSTSKNKYILKTVSNDAWEEILSILGLDYESLKSLTEDIDSDVDLDVSSVGDRGHYVDTEESGYTYPYYELSKEQCNLLDSTTDGEKFNFPDSVWGELRRDGDKIWCEFFSLEEGRDECGIIFDMTDEDLRLIDVSMEEIPQIPFPDNIIPINEDIENVDLDVNERDALNYIETHGVEIPQELKELIVSDCSDWEDTPTNIPWLLVKFNPVLNEIGIDKENIIDFDDDNYKNDYVMFYGNSLEEYEFIYNYFVRGYFSSILHEDIEDVDLDVCNNVNFNTNIIEAYGKKVFAVFSTTDKGKFAIADAIGLSHGAVEDIPCDKFVIVINLMDTPTVCIETKMFNIPLENVLNMFNETGDDVPFALSEIEGVNIPVNESKEDKEKFLKWANGDEELVNRFYKEKQRLGDKDIYSWMKRTPEELKHELDSLGTTRSMDREEAMKGAKLLSENEFWKVYKIMTPGASKLLGKGTKWCVSGDSVISVKIPVEATSEKRALVKIIRRYAPLKIDGIEQDDTWEDVWEASADVISGDYYFQNYKENESASLYFLISKEDNKECYGDEKLNKIAIKTTPYGDTTVYDSQDEEMDMTDIPHFSSDIIIK